MRSGGIGLFVAWSLLCLASSNAQAQEGRTACKAAIKSEQRGTAIATCKRSLQANREPEEMTDLVRAFMLGQGPLAPAELHEAIVLSRTAGRWGDYYSAIARCYLARRLGDEAMINTCTKTLSQQYAHLPDAQEALSEMKTRTPWTLVMAWLVFFGTVLATLVHGTKRYLKTRAANRATAAIVTVTVAFVCLAAGHPAVAQEGTPVDIDIPNRFPVNDENPSSNVPTEKQRNEYPMDFGYFLQENLDRAERATKDKRHADAAKYYKAIAAAVPDVAIGATKLCESLELAGNFNDAIAACKSALGRLGAKVTDHTRFAKLVLSQQGPLPQSQVDDLKASVAHLKSQAESTKDNEIMTVAFDVECEIAKRTKNMALLASCAAGLAKLDPHSARSISLQWAVAMNNNDKVSAQRLVAVAVEHKLPQDVVSMMKQGTESLEPAWRRTLSDWRVLAAALAVVTVVVLLIFGRRSSLRQRVA